MYLQRLTNYLLHHRLQALVLTFLITYVPVIGVVNILIAAFMTLCRGIVEGALFTLVATLPYVLVFILDSYSPQAQILLITALIVTVGNLLTWGFAVMLRRGSSWSVILQLAALVGVLFISIVHLVNPNVDTWWAGQLQTFYTQTSVLASAVPADQVVSNETTKDTINALKQVATGVLVTFLLLTALLQLVAARWWQAAVFDPGSLRKELHKVRLSKLASMLFLISIVFYYLGNSVVLDIMPILCLLFSVAGLSVAHYLCGLMKPANGRFWLAVLYISLMYSVIAIAMLPLFAVLNMLFLVLIGVMILLFSVVFFTILGLLDVWWDFRNRYKQI